MQVSYSLERKDLWYGTWYTATRHPRCLVMWFFLALVIGMRAATEHSYAGAAEVAAAYVLITAAAICLWTIIWVLMRMPSRRTLRPCTDEIDIWGYHCRVPEGVQGVPWAKVQQIRETAEYLFIFASRGQGYPIPKRAFASAGEAERFREMALAYLRAARTGEPVEPIELPGNEGSWPPAPKSPHEERSAQ